MHERNELIISLFRKHLGGFEVYEKQDVWHQRLLGVVMFWMWGYEKDESISLGRAVVNVLLPLLAVGSIAGSIIGGYEGFLFGHTLTGLAIGASLGAIASLSFAVFQIAKGARRIERRYMTDFISFVGKALFVPDMDRLEAYSFWRVLAHEFVHGWDAKEKPLMSFQLGYVVPQVLAFLALLAIGKIWVPWMAWFGICQVFLLPLPAPVRAWAEKRGYTMTLAASIWDGWSDENVERRIEGITQNFTSGDYYWMWPFRSRVTGWFTEAVEDIKSGAILDDEPFRIVHDAIEVQG